MSVIDLIIFEIEDKFCKNSSLLWLNNSKHSCEITTEQLEHLGLSHTHVIL